MSSEITDKLNKFKRYLKKQNFNGCIGYLKKNIVGRFDELFEEELKKKNG